MQSNDCLDRANQLLETCHHLLSFSSTTGVPDILFSIQHLSAEICQMATRQIEMHQQCPGLYWRNTPEVQSRIKTINTTKKRRINPSIRCVAPPGDMDIGKSHAGPDAQRICKVCYETWRRDRRDGVIALDQKKN